MGADQASESGSWTRHRVSFWPTYWVCVGWTTLVILVFTVIAERAVPEPFVFAFTVGVTIGMQGLLLEAWVTYFATKVGANGIRGFDVFGRKRFMRWDDIGAVRAINLGGLKYLRAFSADGHRPIWLPLFLENRRAFEEGVIAAAPDRNVLRDFLAARVGAGDET
jgi:hypothetical protein